MAHVWLAANKLKRMLMRHRSLSLRMYTLREKPQLQP